MPRLQTVTFVKKCAPYAVGEVAGFRADKADAYIRAGVAVEGQREVQHDGPRLVMPGDTRRGSTAPKKGDIVRGFVSGIGDVGGELLANPKDGKARVRTHEGEEIVLEGDLRVVRAAD